MQLDLYTGLKHAMMCLMLAGSLAGTFCGAAGAQTPDRKIPECPENPEQILLGIKSGIGTKYKSAGEVYKLAREARMMCPERSVLNGIAADIFVSVGQSLSKPEDQFRVYSQAYEALVANDWFFDSHAPQPVATLNDGTTQPIYYYGTAMRFVEPVIKKLAALARKGHVHAIFNGEPLQTCPYKNGRAEFEAKGLRDWAVSSSDASIYERAIVRVKSLQSLCSKRPAELAALLTDLQQTYATYLARKKDFAGAIPPAERALENGHAYLDTYTSAQYQYGPYWSQLSQKALREALDKYRMELNKSLDGAKE